MVDLETSWTTTSGVAGVNFCINCLVFDFLNFLVTVVNPVSEVLVVRTIVQKTERGVTVVRAKEGVL